MTREELSQMVELLRDTAKLHQPNEEILTDVKAESFVLVMDSVLAELQKNESAEEWYKLLCEKWDSAENKGEWIELPKALNPNENPCECSKCGHILSFMNGYPKSNFCPNCGADMRGE